MDGSNFQDPKIKKMLDDFKIPAAGEAWCCVLALGDDDDDDDDELGCSFRF